MSRVFDKPHQSKLFSVECPEFSKQVRILCEYNVIIVCELEELSKHPNQEWYWGR
jgi:hypothetical protein